MCHLVNYKHSMLKMFSNGDTGIFVLLAVLVEPELKYSHKKRSLLLFDFVFDR